MARRHHASIPRHVESGDMAKPRRCTRRETIRRGAVAYNRPFRTTGVAVMAGCMLAIANTTIASAATIEEVAHCRAIPRLAERLNCFKSLKPGPRPKTEDVAPGKKQDAGSSKVKDAERAKVRQAAPAKTEHAATAKTEQAAPAKMGQAAPAKMEQ